MRTCANVLIIQNGEYVLQHRDDNPEISEPGTYSIWGGTAENGETPLQVAVRELKEETGIQLGSESLKPINTYMVPRHKPEYEGELVEMHVFSLELKDSETIDCREGQGIVRLPVGQPLDPKINKWTAKAIKDYETAA